jgi:hypothetical protein
MINELERVWNEAVMELQEVISCYFLVWVEKGDREPISGERFESGPPQYES